jgi:succinate dehydrogenase/fumarate reductase cytochrome b subunit
MAAPRPYSPPSISTAKRKPGQAASIFHRLLGWNLYSSTGAGRFIALQCISRRFIVFLPTGLWFFPIWIVFIKVSDFFYFTVIELLPPGAELVTKGAEISRYFCCAYNLLKSYTDSV